MVNPVYYELPKYDFHILIIGRNVLKLFFEYGYKLTYTIEIGIFKYCYGVILFVLYDHP